MQEPFADILKVGGKSNSLGRSQEVIESVLADHDRLDELYACLFMPDGWARMRAADAIEKVCRVNPAWIEQYTDRILTDLSTSRQPSIQWHLAQIYRQIDLTLQQRQSVILWLENLLSTVDVDWIVSANVMDTLLYFVRSNLYKKQNLERLIAVQQNHASKSVRKRCAKLLDELAAL